MPDWIIFAAIGSIIVTAGLTWVLWRINAPKGAPSRQRQDKSGDGGAVYPGDGGSGRSGQDHNGNDSSDGGSDGGGGGGDGGGGGGE